MQSSSAHQNHLLLEFFKQDARKSLTSSADTSQVMYCLCIQNYHWARMKGQCIKAISRQLHLQLYRSWPSVTFQGIKLSELVLGRTFPFLTNYFPGRYFTALVNKIDQILSGFFKNNLKMKRMIFVFTTQNSKQGAVTVVTSSKKILAGVYQSCKTSPGL